MTLISKPPEKNSGFHRICATLSELPIRSRKGIAPQCLGLHWLRPAKSCPSGRDGLSDARDRQRQCNRRPFGCHLHRDPHRRPKRRCSHDKRDAGDASERKGMSALRRLWVTGIGKIASAAGSGLRKSGWSGCTPGNSRHGISGRMALRCGDCPEVAATGTGKVKARSRSSRDNRSGRSPWHDRFPVSDGTAAPVWPA
jgi:hypothetical protein